jgi:hypothetical protein
MGALRNIAFNLADCLTFGATYIALETAWVGTPPHARGGRNLAALD